ncbi:MAG TPA: molybdopterin-binding protein [Blastocatellia bacterium]|jgi:molybdenum cofactor synthesis domain-containing protein
MVTVEIIVIGNEILLGLVQDTNSNYLCRVLREMSARVRHISAVRDEIDSISEEVRASLDRGADVIFTCGGLGPTDDDLTLEGVARATGRKTVIDATARDFVERRYAELARLGYVSSAGLSESRLKMARLPEGACPVENPVGSAPACALEASGKRIISLPGVPGELKAIVEGPLQTLLGEIFGRGSYREREILVECGDESLLAPALREVSSRHKDVYIKSRASRFDRDPVFRIQISASAKSAGEAEALVSRAESDLKSAFQTAGIKQKQGL